MSKTRRKPVKAVADYWAEFYIEKHVCSLCGNSGVIDTTGTAVSPKGVKVGRKNFCICPNGQVFRLQGVTL